MFVGRSVGVMPTDRKEEDGIVPSAEREGTKKDPTKPDDWLDGRIERSLSSQTRGRRRKKVSVEVSVAKTRGVYLSFWFVILWGTCWVTPPNCFKISNETR